MDNHPPDSQSIPRAKTTESNGEISCSFEETNRIRAMLGLRPLDIDPKPTHAQKGKETQEKGSDTVNDRISRIQKRRHVRDLAFGKGQLLYAEEQEAEEDLDHWIKRVGTEAHPQLQNHERTKPREKQEDKPASRPINVVDLDEEALRPGESIELNLRDTNVLDEGENADELILPGFRDVRKDHDHDLGGDHAKQLDQIKPKFTIQLEANEPGKNKLVFFPRMGGDVADQDDDEEHEEGGDNHGVRFDALLKLQAIRQRLLEQSTREDQDDMALNDAHVPSEPQVNEKETKTKMKTKKERERRDKRLKRDKNTKRRVQFDDNDDNEANEETNSSLPLQVMQERMEKMRQEADSSAADMDMDWGSKPELMDIEVTQPDEDPDDDDREIREAMERARRAAFKATLPQTPSVIARIVIDTQHESSDKEEQANGAREPGGLVIDDFIEFTRKIQGMEDADESDGESNETDMGKQDESPSLSRSKFDFPNTNETDLKFASATDSVGEQDSNSGPQNADTASAPTHTMSFGISAALQHLRNQGDLDRFADRRTEQVGRANDKRLETMDPELDRIRLEYVDEFGRRLTPKEAFRHLSYKFHGIKPGKKKQEKRLKAYLTDLRAKQQSMNGDTPLQSVAALKAETSAKGKAFVVLSGREGIDELQEAGAVWNAPHVPLGVAANSSAACAEPQATDGLVVEVKEPKRDQPIRMELRFGAKRRKT